MAHAITQRADGTFEMAFTGADPWHIRETNATRLPEDAPLDAWIDASGLHFEIKESPVLFDTGDDGDEAVRRFPGRKVLYREDTRFPLGDVSDSYKAVQPREVAEFFDSLITASGFKMETMMTLHGGKKYLALARVTADLPILDHKDKVGGYLLLSTSADGTSATEGRWTTTRVVCQNTLTLALRGKASVKINHRSQFDAEAAKAELGLVGDDARHEFEKGMETLRELARAPLDNKGLLDLTLRTFGFDPSKMEVKDFQEALKKKAVANIAQLAVGGASSGLIGGDMKGVSRTAWGFVNAVTQYIDHSVSKRTGIAGTIDRSLMGEGERLKNKAFKLAATHVGILSDSDEAKIRDDFDFRALMTAG